MFLFIFFDVTFSAPGFYLKCQPQYCRYLGFYEMRIVLVSHKFGWQFLYAEIATIIRSKNADIIRAKTSFLSTRITKAAY